MRVGVVHSSALARAPYRRMDAAYFLGDRDVIDGTEVHKAELNLQKAQTRLATELQRREDEIARVQAMQISGDVLTIKESKTRANPPTEAD